MVADPPGERGGEPPTDLVSALWPPRAPGKRIAILKQDGTRTTRTHGDVLEEAGSWASGLIEAGVRPGEAVGLVAGTNFGFIVACLAVWRAGAVAVPLPQSSRRMSRDNWDATTAARLSAAKVGHFIGSPEQLPPSSRDLECLLPEELAGQGGGAALPDVRPEDVAMIQFTSGSTSGPKGIVLRHRTLTGWIARGRGAEDQHHLRLTPLHFGGVSGSIARPLAFGWDLTLIPPRAFIARPELWLRQISDHGVTHSSAPNFAFALATRALQDDGGFDLSGWDLVGCGAGEGASLDIIERFVAAAVPRGLRETSLNTQYASTEAGRVSARRPGTGLRVEMFDRAAFHEGRADPTSDGELSLVSSGFPYDDLRLRVVDDESRELPERVVGEFQVAGEYLMDGYLDDPAGTAAVMDGEWLRTGDLGFVADGEVFVTGRKKDLIIVHGQNFHPADIESIAGRAIPGGRVVAFAARGGGTDALVLAVEASSSWGSESETKRALSAAVWRATGLPVSEVVLVAPGTLPATDSGKPQRARTRELFEAGELGR